MNYPNSRRDDYINVILRRQLNDGGWNLSGGETESTKNGPSDPDLTGMALQALAKYQHKPEVKAAIDKALACLSTLQNANGGYTSWGSENVESASQVLVALCELGISIDDPRFVKNGKTLVDNILTFKTADGSFKHTQDGDGNGQMSTEQALYALVAAQRSLNGVNSLYRMDDTVKRGEFAPLPTTPGLPGKHADVAVMPVVNAGKTFADVKNHANQTAIEALAGRGIINGKSDTLFDPNATMTRAEFATIVVRGLGLPLIPTPSRTFTDFAVNAWYGNTVETAYYYGIVTGTSATTFNPDGTITRQEAAVMVARAAKLCGMDTERDAVTTRDTLAQFMDYRTVADWAQPSMAFCYDVGILDDSEMDIQPLVAVKRCEVAEMLYRMLGLANLL